MLKHSSSTQTIPMLFYKDSCPPCRTMSRLAVILALGLIRRYPLNSEEAKALYALNPGSEGQLMLIDGNRIWLQRMVYAALPGCAMKRLLKTCFHLFLPPTFKRG